MNIDCKFIHAFLLFKDKDPNLSPVLLILFSPCVDSRQLNSHLSVCIMTKPVPLFLGESGWEHI